MPQQTKSNGKLLLICQFWAGDADQMMGLLGLIADLEPRKSESADIMLFPRRDCKYRNSSIPPQIYEKFGVIAERGKRWAAGWPTGPNALAMDAFRLAQEKHNSGEWNYAGYMLIESDCVPLKAGWIEDLLNEWSGQSNPFLGHWIGHNDCSGVSHMNGNLIFHPRAIDSNPFMAHGQVPIGGWDAVWWSIIRPICTPSKLIYSDYRMNTVKNPWRGCDSLWEDKVNNEPTNPLYGQVIKPCWLHGIKGNVGIECVRKRFLQKGIDS